MVDFKSFVGICLLVAFFYLVYSLLCKAQSDKDRNVGRSDFPDPSPPTLPPDSPVI